MKSTTYVEFSHPPSLSGLSGVPQDRDAFTAARFKTCMQPPTSSPGPLRAHLYQLLRNAQQRSPTLPINQVDLFSNSIRSWVNSMAPEQRTRRFSIDEVALLACLKGKHGGRPAHHHIAQALRMQGFECYRDWTTRGRNKRFWKFTDSVK